MNEYEKLNLKKGKIKPILDGSVTWRVFPGHHAMADTFHLITSSSSPFLSWPSVYLYMSTSRSFTGPKFSPFQITPIYAKRELFIPSWQRA